MKLETVESLPEHLVKKSPGVPRKPTMFDAIEIPIGKTMAFGCKNEEEQEKARKDLLRWAEHQEPKLSVKLYGTDPAEPAKDNPRKLFVMVYVPKARKASDQNGSVSVETTNTPEGSSATADG